MRAKTPQTWETYINECIVYHALMYNHVIRVRYDEGKRLAYREIYSHFTRMLWMRKVVIISLRQAFQVFRSIR